ncbi:PREDICTED: lysophospholipid acyltransferase 1-like isoform X2 [Priapulus caudatus]|uniref:Lysophospholipid acyltransferase 1-like isoform X2 n=1 Tax=Priapulus caudatus TaxID=37621 RepID=A0ABM1EGC2_PRICU|nr:PREDICTED: lysophospholipid acyltransferase 1-like isoform X2 [Priapulus caudatus]
MELFSYGVPSRPNIAMYQGSQLLKPLSRAVGLPIDQVNFTCSMLMSLIASVILRLSFHPSHTTATVRHIYCVAIGLTIGVFCWGGRSWNVILFVLGCYMLLRTVGPQHIQKVVFVYSMAYLTVLHWYRLKSYGVYVLDISGPVMVMTQKMTTLAFNIHDGLAQTEEQLSPECRKHAVRKIPPPIEFASYLLNFQTILCGPCSQYNDYIDYIEGRSLQSRSPTANGSTFKDVPSSKEPSPVRAVMEKLGIVLVLVFVNLKLLPLFPMEYIREEKFLMNTGFIGKTTYILCATTVTRAKYYFAWVMADVVCNASGFGFNGYNEDGTERWDLVQTVHIARFEFSLSWRDSLASWNTQTMVWLRMIAYERAPCMKTFLTYLLSAYWHGFFPGYYLTFGAGALVTIAARNVRRSIRPVFQKSRTMVLLYHVMTFLACRLVVAYVTFPFMLLSFWPSIQIYKSMYFYIHIAILLATFILPVVLPPPKPGSTTENSASQSSRMK